MVSTDLQDLVGRTIVEVRPMTDEEKYAEGWEHFVGSPLVLILDNGLKLYPSEDEEGNGPGALFGAKGTLQILFS